MARRPNRPQQPNRGPSFNASGNWQQRGFESQDAARSVSRQYGLMQQPGGGWGRPTMDQFTGMMETAGYGPKFQAQSTNEAGTPVSIGGARWMMGKNGLNFTGQASDYGQGGGNAYTAAQQVPYQVRRPQGPGDNRMPNAPGMNAPRTNVGFNGGNRPQGPGRPGGGGGGGRPGGGGGGRPGGGGGGRPGGQQGGFPQNPPAPPNYLPMTPGFESARRGLEDQLAAAGAQYGAQVGQVAPMIGLQQSRAQTDVGYANKALLENLANRGMVQSGSYPELYQRDIGVPYGRMMQDLALGGMNQYGGLAEQFGGANLGYNQGIIEALLQRAAEAPSVMPLSTGMYGYNMPGKPPKQGGGGRPNKPPKQGSRGRGTRKGNKGRPNKPKGK